MCQYIVVQYTMRHPKYVPVSSYTVNNETSENMYQYLVVQYTMKHQKYMPVSSCKVHEASEICASN